MSDPFVAEIRIFGFNFAPTGWALCNGQLMPISQNTALFSLLGTIYGGDGKTTFALPDLQGTCPTHQGQGAGLQRMVPRRAAGTRKRHAADDRNAVPQSRLHRDDHGAARPTLRPSNQLGKGGGQSRLRHQPGVIYSPNAPQTAPMQLQALASTGGSLPHNNMKPYLVLNYCIALQGVFPPRGRRSIHSAGQAGAIARS